MLFGAFDIGRGTNMDTANHAGTTDADIADMLKNAWKRALENAGQNGQSGNHQMENKKRSSEWVNALAKELRDLVGPYEHKEQLCVFWRGKCKEYQPFGLRELLFDIAVCRICETKSFNSATARPFVAECLWQVESELKPDARSIIKDLSKLVMGCSKRKLFVAGVPCLNASKRNKRECAVLEMCSTLADRCGAFLYFCFIPKPGC